MNSDCILCGTNATQQPALPQIFDAFRVVLRVLEKQAHILENECSVKLRRLNSQLDEVTAKSRALEEEKINSDKRSDLYKNRFLDAQKAIEQLHEKNVQLSSQRSRLKIPLEELRNFPFPPSRQKNDFSPETKKMILAPDTYAPDTEPHLEEVTYISSDEEDFKQDSKVKSKSPRRSPKVGKISPKSVMDSFFAKPMSPPRSVKRKKVAPDTPVANHDLDETRLDGGDPMEMSLGNGDSMDTSPGLETSVSAKLAEAIGDTAVLELCTEMDSIPPSPVLSGGKERRFGLFRKSRGSFPKSNDPSPSPTLLNANRKFSNPTTLRSSNFVKIKHSNQGSANSQSWQADNLLKETLPLHRPPSKHTPGNTSLDDLFNKTDGDLETTTMLNNTTWDEMKDIEQEDTDDELDALLLQGVNEAEGSHCAGTTTVPSTSFKNKSAEAITPQTSTSWDRDSRTRKMAFEDSFDVLPSKLKDAKKDFKYQGVVRKRDEREKLDAKACAQCEEYYSDLPEEERQEIMRKVCRHKHVDAPPSTPEHFWEVGIPDTEECRRRGYFTDETVLPPEARKNGPRMRRKKPLEPFFNKKR